VFVVDMIKDFAGNAAAAGRQVSHGGGKLPAVTMTQGAAPTVKVPNGNPPKNLTTQVLVKGSGPTVADGDTVVVQYVGAIWRNGYVFDSSWKRSQPFGFTIGASPSQVILGWDRGLAGQTVGSRVMLVIPPADGYGKSGSPQAHIKGTDTLVFVVDILGAFGAAQG
jgi:peptidylprolyl isomerase